MSRLVFQKITIFSNVPEGPNCFQEVGDPIAYSYNLWFSGGPDSPLHSLNSRMHLMQNHAAEIAMCIGFVWAVLAARVRSPGGGGSQYPKSL